MYSINNSTNHNKTKLNQQKPSLGNRCFPVQTGLARCIECIHNGTRRAYTPGQQGWSVDCLQRKPNMLWREERLLTLLSCRNLEIPDKLKCKGKAIITQAWTGPDFSRKLRLPDFKTFSRKFVSHMHQLPVSHKKYALYSFLSEAKSTPDP